MTLSHEDDVKMLLSAFEQRLEQLLPAGEQEGQVYAAMREATLVAQAHAPSVAAAGGDRHGLQS